MLKLSSKSYVTVNGAAMAPQAARARGAICPLKSTRSCRCLLLPPLPSTEEYMRKLLLQLSNLCFSEGNVKQKLLESFHEHLLFHLPHG